MELTNMKDALKKLQLERHFYGHAAGILHFDGDTVAPRASAKYRGETAAFLSQKGYELMANPKTAELLDTLWELKDELDEINKQIAAQSINKPGPTGFIWPLPVKPAAQSWGKSLWALPPGH